jgi:hypothetical protein
LKIPPFSSWLSLSKVWYHIFVLLLEWIVSSWNMFYLPISLFVKCKYESMTSSNKQSSPVCIEFRISIRWIQEKKKRFLPMRMEKNYFFY